MNLIPAGLGADKKKVMWLAGLVLVGLPIAWYLGRPDDTSRGPAAAPVAPAAQNPSPLPTLPVISKDAQKADAALNASMQRRGASNRTDDFHPSLKPKEGVDLNGIDPTLHLDLLAKLHNLPMEGGARSVFKEGAKPVPPPAPVTVKPGPVLTSNGTPAGGPKPPEPPSGPPPPPPPTPIPLKFYGYSTRGSAKRAFFMDGDEIQIAGENDTIRNRYKIIKIGVNSAVVEDTTDKHQQTLPLEKELDG
jgi:hypothetical protein